MLSLWNLIYTPGPGSEHTESPYWTAVGGGAVQGGGVEGTCKEFPHPQLLWVGDKYSNF